MRSKNPIPTPRESSPARRRRSAAPRLAAALLGQLVLLLLVSPLPAVAQPMPPAARPGPPALSPRELPWVLPRAPLGTHCVGSVVCTELGTWGIHARLTGSTLILSDGALPGGMLTPAASLTLGGWGEVGAHFPILLGPPGTEPLPLPPVLFAKGAFTPPFWVGTHGVLFATLTLPSGPFAAPDDRSQPMARRYEVGAAISGHLLWRFHYGLSMSGQLSPGGPASRLLTGVELQARFDGFNVFAQPSHSAALCDHGSSSKDCQSSVALLVGLQLPLVAGHSSVAAGPTRGAPDQSGTMLTATVGASFDETTRKRYGNGIAKIEQLWMRLFTAVIDPYLDERCMLWDDDHAPMTALGIRSADGSYCERQGLRTPINTHFDRNKASTRVCYDAGLRNCILHRDSDKDPWQVVPGELQARRPYLKKDCHVYEAGVLLPLQQVGIHSPDGQACEWQGHRFPIGTEFWALPGDGVMCLDATLKHCSIALPPRPMTTGQYVGSRAEQGLVHAVTELGETFERGPWAAAELAAGRLHVGTVAREGYETLKDGLGHLTLEDAKKRAAGVVTAGREWLKQPLHVQLGDVAEGVGKLPVQALENEISGGLGNLAGGAGGAALGAARTEKAIVKTASKAENAVAKKAGHAVGKAEATTIEHRVPAHLPTQESDLPGRHGAFRAAKRDAGIPRGQQPDAVKTPKMTDRWDNPVLNAEGRPINTREYEFTRPDGKKVVIQDHGAGHQFGQGGTGDQGSHFNVRPDDRRRTGNVTGTQKHYPFDKR